jgi:hypothetical protein
VSDVEPEANTKLSWASTRQASAAIRLHICQWDGEYGKQYLETQYEVIDQRRRRLEKGIGERESFMITASHACRKLHI